MHTATLMLLGAGELGREFAIAAKRLGCRMIACDRYANAPAMQVADGCEVFPMLDGAALRAAVEKHKPDVVVPELEMIDTATRRISSAKVGASRPRPRRSSLP
jgi:phosphoribosylglycinamide formyltransferase 2